MFFKKNTFFEKSVSRKKTQLRKFKLPDVGNYF